MPTMTAPTQGVAPSPNLESATKPPMKAPSAMPALAADTLMVEAMSTLPSRCRWASALSRWSRSCRRPAGALAGKPRLRRRGRHPYGLRRPWSPCARKSQGSARFPGRTDCAGFGLKLGRDDYPMVGPRCLPISHDTPPPRTVAAICCPSRCSITSRHGTRLNPMPSSSMA